MSEKTTEEIVDDLDSNVLDQPNMPAPLHEAIDDAITRLAALQSRIDELTTLRPMADAPRDGRDILICRGQFLDDWHVGFWCDEEEAFLSPDPKHNFTPRIGDMRGWLPLPEIEGGTET
ncbi:MAG: hypothetical protein MJH10_09690 [Epibacterium sp.]|nr:hypothetical protein [Epibacterium sp.]NQX73807.1 hypothetical protein [Epibacterium sp.]